MKKTINLDDFVTEWRNSTRSRQFTTEALTVLFDYYEEIEEGTGEQIELDIIAICCEWTEYDSLNEALAEYGIDPENSDDLYNSAANVLTIPGTDRLLVQNY